MKNAALLLLLATLLCGCTSTHISKVGDSFTIIRKSFGTKHTIADLTVTVGTNAQTFRMQGYSNDQAKALALAIESAVKGAVEGMK